uniref:Uncharacterized protein n=1 Tax=Anguilla anguilla TaxID=7936 RepID=A0A0E9TJW8_ANGAN
MLPILPLVLFLYSLARTHTRPLTGHSQILLVLLRIIVAYLAMIWLK